MSGLWVAAGLFTLLALWFVVRPLIGRRDTHGAPRDALNVELYREQVRELDADLANGLIAAEQIDFPWIGLNGTDALADHRVELAAQERQR